MFDFASMIEEHLLDIHGCEDVERLECSHDGETGTLILTVSGRVYRVAYERVGKV